ncbi:MGMT family protein [bacterium]|nr:MGMT family protein [bacterium]
MSTYEKIYIIIRQIPYGCVATYGQVARLAGLAGHARQVGYALHASKIDQGLPWHRVINAKGEISLRSDPTLGNFQQHLLEEEGVRFSKSGRLNLNIYGWQPDVEPLSF